MQSQVLDIRARRNIAVPLRRPRFEPPVRVLLRRKWLALFIMAAVLTAVVTVVMTLPNIYEASATVLVERPQVPENFVRSTVTSGINSRLQFLNQQILSSARLTSLVQRFDLYPALRQQALLEAAVARMQADIRVQLQETSSQSRYARRMTMFTLTYRGDDPQKVADVTNTLISFYIEEHAKVREQQAAGTTEFLQAQVLKLRQQLEQLERKLSQFKEQYIGELPEQLAANLATLERLNAQLRLTSDKLIRANERRTSLTQYMAQARQLGPNVSLTAPGQQQTATSSLVNLYQELAILRTRYSDKYPDVIRLKTKIAMLEQQVMPAPPTQPGESIETVSMDPRIMPLQQELSTVGIEIKALEAEERSLLQSIALYQRRVENTPRREQELQVLSRDYETTRDLYQALLKQQGQANLAASMEQRQQGEQFRLLEAATSPQAPASPQRAKLILGGLVLSLVAAIGTVFFVDKRDASFHVVEDLQDFSPVPVLASLPRIVTKHDVRRQRLRFSVAMVSALLALGLIAIFAYSVMTGKLLSFNLPLLDLFGL